VLASSTLSKVQAPLVQLELAIQKSGTNKLSRETIELAPSELEATLATLGQAAGTLSGLPQPERAK
jgi:hypothetical protein